MLGKRTRRLLLGLGLKSRNAPATSRIHLPPRAVAIAILAVGVLALVAVSPAAAADAPQYRDDNSSGKCPGSYTLIRIGLLNDYLEVYDLNQDGLVCRRGL